MLPDNERLKYNDILLKYNLKYSMIWFIFIKINISNVLFSSVLKSLVKV